MYVFLSTGMEYLPWCHPKTKIKGKINRLGEYDIEDYEGYNNTFEDITIDISNFDNYTLDFSLHDGTYDCP